MFKLSANRRPVQMGRVGLGVAGAWLTQPEGLKYPLLWVMKSQTHSKSPVRTAGR